MGGVEVGVFVKGGYGFRGVSFFFFVSFTCYAVLEFSIDLDVMDCGYMYIRFEYVIVRWSVSVVGSVNLRVMVI